MLSRRLGRAQLLQHTRRPSNRLSMCLIRAPTTVIYIPPTAPIRPCLPCRSAIATCLPSAHSSPAGSGPPSHSPPVLHHGMPHAVNLRQPLNTVGMMMGRDESTLPVVVPQWWPWRPCPSCTARAPPLAGPAHGSKPPTSPPCEMTITAGQSGGCQTEKKTASRAHWCHDSDSV